LFAVKILLPKIIISKFKISQNQSKSFVTLVSEKKGRFDRLI